MYIAKYKFYCIINNFGQTDQANKKDQINHTIST